MSAGSEADCPLRQSDQPHNNSAPQTPITVKIITTQCKETYQEHRKEETKSQSRLECYLALNREDELAEYLYGQRQKAETDPDPVQAQ